MGSKAPHIIVIAGPNGAGKSTATPELIGDTLHLTEFVNADVIARGLSPFEPERAALTAGRVMLQRLHELAAQRSSFGFETTLASRTFAPWIDGLMRSGYKFELLFLWLPRVETSLLRVQTRVKLGGHPVPEEVIRRRYEAGLDNFFNLYSPIASTWVMYDNSRKKPRLVAKGQGPLTTVVGNEEAWESLAGRYKRI